MNDLQEQPKTPKSDTGGLAVMATTLGLMLFVSLVAMIWITVTFLDLKSNFDTKLKVHGDTVKIATSEKLNAEFAERERSPYRQFVGPDDLGRVAFVYPKTWSQFIHKDDKNYEVFFNPEKVRPVKPDTRYALRLLIEDVDYVKTVEKYTALIKSAKLRQSITTVNGQQSTRLEGEFTEKIKGTAVIFKIRDKTVTLRTDTDEVHKDQFNKILESIQFNN